MHLVKAVDGICYGFKQKGGEDTKYLTPATHTFRALKVLITYAILKNFEPSFIQKDSSMLYICSH